ncbi:MAG: hypothetical protein R3B54_06690 [Bdellovibrionota bacterium]
MAAYLQKLAAACSPYLLRVESPIAAPTREKMLQGYQVLREKLKGETLALVVDEWANTVDDILEFARSGSVDMIHIKMPDLGSVDNSVKAVQICQKHGINLYWAVAALRHTSRRQLQLLSRSRSAPVFLMAKSGMGVNEAVSRCATKCSGSWHCSGEPHVSSR